MQTIVEKWQETGMLDGMKSDRVANLAHCMEAQVEFNKTQEDSEFKKFSIPLVNRIMRGSQVFQRNHFDISDGMNEARYHHIFNAIFVPPKGGLEEDAQYATKLSDALLREFDGLFRDQYNKYITIHGFQATENGNIILHYDM